MRKHTKYKSRVLMCAYACSPDRGSEESVGWDTAVQLASRGHEVVILTRSTEKALSEPKSQLLQAAFRPTFATCDISPIWTRLFGWLGKIGVDVAYFVWLLKARRTVTLLHTLYQFTSSQHVTYARYWMPSPLSRLDIPFVWGPVGGGESIPANFLKRFTLKGRLFEFVRNIMRKVGESFSLTKQNATQNHIALANTTETAERMRRMGAESIQIMNSAALSEEDQRMLQKAVPKQENLTFVSVGRLLEWKGFQLGLEAFSRANIPGARYLIIGSGPFRSRLVSLAQRLGIQEQVQFIASMPRNELFDLMISSHALVHPSMHESGGYVCLEMMAAGNPVICLQAGGPSLFVSESCGFLATSADLNASMDEMAAFMTRLAKEPNLGMVLGQHGKQRVRNLFSMTVKSDELSLIHQAAGQVLTDSTKSNLEQDSKADLLPVTPTQKRAHSNLNAPVSA